MNSKMKYVTTFAVVAVIHLAVAASAVGQLRPPKGEAVNTCTASDKLEVTSFLVGRTEPLKGETVKVEMKIKNKCPSGTGDLAVEWNIKKSGSAGTETAASGTETISPGATSRALPANWTATAGTFTFSGTADPNQRHTESERANNVKSSESVTTFEEKLLDYQLAKNAGAQFRDNRQSTPTDCQYLGQFDANDQSKPYTGYTPGASFTAWCPSATGGKADPEAFDNFTLKNDWTIRRVELTESYKVGSAGWSQTIVPANGTNNPHTKVHMWADRGGSLTVILKITVRGKAGTSPYQ